MLVAWQLEDEAPHIMSDVFTGLQGDLGPYSTAQSDWVPFRGQRLVQQDNREKTSSIGVTSSVTTSKQEAVINFASVHLTRGVTLKWQTRNVQPSL